MHPNKLPQRIFLYHVGQLDWGQSKIWYFQFLKSILRSKINLFTLKMIFVLKYQTRRPTFSKRILSFIHTHQILFSKDVPYLFGSQLSCLARYQKILWECSFGDKNLLNFSFKTKKFHNCHHPKSHIYREVPYNILFRIDGQSKEICLIFQPVEIKYVFTLLYCFSWYIHEIF